MKSNMKKNGFIAISMIYSVFVLFVTILIAIMFSYITDRKSSNAIKQDIKNRFSAKLPETIYTNVDNNGLNAINVQINIKRGSFPVGTSKYIWSKSQSAVPNKIIGNGGIVSLSYDEEPGNYYLITQACDVFDNCTVTISNKYVIEESSTLIPGSQFNSKLISLANEAAGTTANIISFKRSIEIDEALKTDNNLISTSSAANPVYAYCTVRTGSGVDCFYYTDAMRVKFNSDSSGMFRNMNSLITVDLGDFDKSAITNNSNFFTGCTALENIRTPMSYPGALPIGLPDIYYNDESIPFNQILATTKSRIWLSKGLVNYTIEYDLDGGELLEDNPVTYNRNTKTFTLNNPVKEGYVFAGWSGGKNIVSYPTTGQYTGVKIDGDTIIFDRSSVLNNNARRIQLFAINNNDSSTISYMLNLTNQPILGYHEASFVYNNTNINRVLFKLDTSLGDAVMELTNLYWLPGRPYVVSFNVDEYNINRTYAKISNLQIELGDRATPFEHHAEKELRVVIPRGSQGSRHYFANWIPVSESKYSLDINPNGGEWQGYKSRVTKRIAYSEAFDIQNPTREGYMFAGWEELNSIYPSENGIDANYANLYNNNHNGAVTISNVTKSQDNPISTTTKELKVVNSGAVNTSPGLGGFINYVTPQNNHTYVHVFVAKLPVGYYFHNAHNSIGTGGSTQWLTSQAGTGKFQTYAYKEVTGTGSLGTFGHVYMSKSLSNTWNVRQEEKGAVTSYIASSNIYDVTSNNNGIGQLDGSAKLTAKWETPKTLTLDLNGGKYKGDSANVVIKGVSGETIDISNNVTKDGYIFYGWDLTGAGTMNYYDGNNKSSYTEISVADYTNPSTALPSAYRSSTVAKATDPDTGGNVLKVTTNVSAGYGGFWTKLYPLTPGRINIVAIEAKIPTGNTFAIEGIGNMYTGVGSQKRRLESAGTGNYKTYYAIVYAGKTGHFQQDVYLTISGTSSSVEWYVKNVKVLSFQPNNLYNQYTFGNENATLKAKWSTSGAKVSFDTNGGSFDTSENRVYPWKNGWFVQSGEYMRFYLYGNNYGTHPGSTNYNWTPDTRVTSKPGYKLDGWYTASSGGTKVFNSDGTLIPSVPGFSDSSGKWIKYDNNVVLYAHWNPNQLTVKYKRNGATHYSSGNNIASSDPISTGGFYYSDTVGYNWPSDYSPPYGLSMVKYGWKPTGYYLVNSATSSTKIPQDLIKDANGKPASDVANSLGVLSSFQNNSITNVDLYPEWTTAFVDNYEINTSTGAGRAASGYMATTDYCAPVKGGITLISNHSICAVYSFDSTGKFIRRESSYTTVHPISANASCIKIEIAKGSNSFAWWRDNLTFTQK